MTLLEQLKDPNEVKRWFDQIGFQAAREIELLQAQRDAAYAAGRKAMAEEIANKAEYKAEHVPSIFPASEGYDRGYRGGLRGLASEIRAEADTPEG